MLEESTLPAHALQISVLSVLCMRYIHAILTVHHPHIPHLHCVKLCVKGVSCCSQMRESRSCTNAAVEKQQLRLTAEAIVHIYSQLLTSLGGSCV